MILSTLHRLIDIFSNKQVNTEIFYSPTLDSNFALYDITKEAYNYYINMVKNNKDEDIYTVRRKLTRNCIIGQELINYGNGYIKYAYGNLDIIVNKQLNKIIRIKNHKKFNNKTFVSYTIINFQLKKELDEILNLQ